MDCRIGREDWIGCDRAVWIRVTRMDDWTGWMKGDDGICIVLSTKHEDSVG